MTDYQKFRRMDALSYAALKADIAARGVMVPIEKDERGNILDGHHRVQICRELGITDYPVTVRFGFSEWDKIEHLRKLNSLRRHMTADEFREQLENCLCDVPEWSDRRIAEIVGVHHTTVATARKRLEDVAKISHVETRTDSVGRQQPATKPKTIVASSPQQAEAAQKLVGTTGLFDSDSTTTVSAAEIIHDANKTLYASSENRESDILAAAQEIRSRRTEERRKERLETLQQIATGNADLNGALGTFPIIYADPPWRYEHAESESRAIENQYPTMELYDICALPLSEVTTPDAVLFLWGTSPKLAEAMRVIEAWGFTYRTCMVWDKEKMGMGYYARQQHELLLIATKGQPPAPAPDARPRSVIRIAREAHSAKPIEFYEIIEAMYPNLPKLEMFCRAPRDGWRAWGNQSKGEPCNTN